MRRVWGCWLPIAALIAANAVASEPEPLPEPELTEPFAIGEALLDPARVDQAVVSLVRLFGIPLSENQVRGLVEMGRADFAASGEGRLPWSFRDLHAAVHPMLPQLSIEDMAQAYTNAYQSAPESTAAQLMLGMPIEPATRLTRPQMWLLLVDGFAAPAQPRVAQLTPAAAPSAGGGTYGAASLMLPPLPSPIPGLSIEDWTYLVSILPLLVYEVPFDIQPLPASGHEGHGGPGPVIPLQARIGFQPRAVVNPTTGRALLQPGNSLRNGRSVTWYVPNRAAIERHGSFDVMQNLPVQTDHSGVAHLNFTPKAEAAQGRGTELMETTSLTAAIRQWELLSTQYQLPPVLMNMLWGERQAPGVLAVGWHDESAIKIRIENNYSAVLEMGFLGSGARSGTDIAEGTLAPQPDGSWEGTVDASVNMNQSLEGMGLTCAPTTFVGTQQLRVRAETVDGISRAQAITYDTAASTGSPGGGFLALDFVPAEPPRISPRKPCLDLYRRDGGIQYLPLNDARWTLKHARYVIELPLSGVLVYKDTTVTEMALAVSVAAGMPWQGLSTWKIRVEKPEPP